MPSFFRGYPIGMSFVFKPTDTTTFCHKRGMANPRSVVCMYLILIHGTSCHGFKIVITIKNVNTKKTSSPSSKNLDSTVTPNKIFFF